MKEPLELIADERQRQIDKYGYTDEHISAADEDYANGQLSKAAAAYLLTQRFITDGSYLPVILFPWDIDIYFKECPTDRIKELVKAGAMIVAEIKRLQNRAK